jgi:hypothetical protein
MLTVLFCVFLQEYKESMLCLGSVPLLYLLFDDLSPALAKRFPALSEFFDNVIVVVLPGRVHCKKRLAVFPPPARMSLIKLALAGNNLNNPAQGEFG